MRPSFFAAVFFGLVAWFYGSPACQAQNLYIFLIGGQSNADSHAPNSGLPAQYQNPLASVPIAYGGATPGGSGILDTTTYYTTLRPGTANYNRTSNLGTSFGTEIGFGWGMDAWLQGVAPGDKIAIVKAAYGGTNLYSHWHGGGTAGTTGDGSVYASFQQVVTAGLAAINNDSVLSGYNKVLSGMLWTQGEADIDAAHPQYAANYAANLTGFIGDIRLTYGNIPFYLSEISLNQTAYGGSNAVYRDQVRAAQEYVAANVADAYLINTDGPQFTTMDTVHFTAASELYLGQSFANQVMATSAIPEPSSWMLLGVGGAAVWLVAGRRKRRIGNCVDGSAVRAFSD